MQAVTAGNVLAVLCLTSSVRIRLPALRLNVQHLRGGRKETPVNPVIFISLKTLFRLSRARRLHSTLLLKTASVACFSSLVIAFSALSLPSYSEELTTGYDAGLTYTADWFKNTRGGQAREARFIDLLSLHGDINTEKAWGHSGGTLHVDYLFSRHTFSDVVGDAQVTSNIDFGDGQHLYELWYEQQLNDNGSSIKTGLYDVNSEFDHVETAGLFLNSSHGAGADFAQSGRSGPSMAPITGLAMRGLWVVNPAWKIQATVAEGVPGDHHGHNERTRIQLSEDEGALTVAEINYLPYDGLRFGLGSWYYTRRFETFNGERDHSNGVYGFADVALGNALAGDWAGFVRLGSANDNVNQFGDYYGAGITWTGKLFQQEDQIGLAIASAQNGDAFRRSENQAGNHWHKAETAIELTYGTRITPWLYVQPDIQYIINPGVDRTLDNALVIGLRMQIDLGVSDVIHHLNH